MTSKPKAIGYVRVSTEEQATDGVSLAAQEAKIKAYADLYDLDLVEIIVDAGQSAKTLDRPGITRALAMLTARQADGIIVAKLDRLTRSVADLNRLIERLFSETSGRLLWSVADAIDTRTAAGRLVLNILASVSQWEREAIAERTRDALRHKKALGQRVGAVPFGSRLAADGITLEPEPAEREVMDLVAELRRTGLSIRGIVSEMNNRGVLTKEGGKWHIATVQRVLAAVA